MSDLLSIGRSGVTAYRAALATVGENVSNAETEGYTLRTITLGEAAISSSGGALYRSSAMFGGVNVDSVQRVADIYRSSYARFATSEASKADVKATWLGTVEDALDDSDVGLGVKMSTVFTSAEALSTDVSSDTNRRAMLTALSDAAAQFNVTATALKSAADGLGTTAQSTVDKLNGDLKTLTQINNALQRATPGSSGQALLQDQRDAVLSSISNAIGVNVRFEGDGRATVTMIGDDSATLVDSANPQAAYVGMVQASDGRISLVTSGLGDERSITPQTGALAAFVDVSNTIASRRNSLDEVAASFADTINNWNQAGLDRDGNAGAALMSGTTADTIALSVTDPAKIAAASTSGAVNGNALALKDTRDSSGPEAKWALLVSTQAQSVASAKAQQSASAAARDGALQQLDEVTGVDLDVEAAQLLRYQQAYSGSARIIQVARETLQDIFNLFN